MRTIIYILIAITALCVSCTSTDSNIIATLDRAETVMEEHPDSALAMLDTLRSESLRTEKDQARYALLYTQARIKNYKDDTSDSLIKIAVEYYDKTSDLRSRAISHFYHGFILSRNDSIIQATKSLLTALNLTDEAKEYLYASLTCAELCRIFQTTLNPAEEVNYAERAYDYMTKSKRQPYWDWSLVCLADAYNNHHMNSKCISLCYQILDTLKLRPNEQLKLQTERTLIRSLITTKQDEKAIPYLEDICTSPHKNSQDMAFLGLCYAIKGNRDSASYILQHLDTITDVTDWLKYELYSRTGDNKKAFESLKDLHNGRENLLEERLKQNATLSIIQHHAHETEIAEERAKTAQTTLWFIIICSILFLSTSTAIIFIIRRKQQYEHLKNEAIAQKLHQTIQLRAMEQRKSESLSETVEQKQATIDQLTEEINQINDAVSQQKQIAAFHATKHYQMIDTACRILWENPSKEAASGKLTYWLDNLTKEMGSSPEKLKALEDIANQCFDNIMADLREALPKIKEEDYKLFLFNLFGLSSAAIARLIDADKIEPVYTRKKRLRGKLKELKDNKGELFLKYLQNDRDLLDFL